MKNFAVIELKFADASDLTSVCAIGLAIVGENEQINRKYWLVKPPKMNFTNSSMAEHGITVAHVANKPDFEKLWPVLHNLVENLKVFGINANFEETLSALYAHFELKDKLQISLLEKYLKENFDLDFTSVKELAQKANLQYIPHQTAENSAVCAQYLITAS
jgi:DNA polymerase III subunit epsilon